MTNLPERIGIVGGSGKLGSALAGRWAKAGFAIMIGSRSEDRAAEAAAKLAAAAGISIKHGTNVDAATWGDIVVVTVPFASQIDTLTDIREVLAGKLVIDTTVPLVPPKVMRAQMPPEGSAALRAQKILGEQITLVSAFHNVAAQKLAQDGAIGCDVLVFSDDKEARARVVGLAEAAGLKGWQAGALANSVAAEALTSVLIFMNKTYGVDGAGIAIVGAAQSDGGGDRAS